MKKARGTRKEGKEGKKEEVKAYFYLLYPPCPLISQFSPHFPLSPSPRRRVSPSSLSRFLTPYSRLPSPNSFLKYKIAIAVCFLVVLLGWQRVNAQKDDETLPPLRVHPLPATLARWRSPSTIEDYFAEIQSTDAGYLIWSEFPIKLYFDRPPNLSNTNNSAEGQRWQQWLEAVLEGIQAWKTYLPIQEVEQANLANIVILRKQPPLGVLINRDTGKIERMRARAAQTQYKLYVSEDKLPRLSHRMTISIDPGLSAQSILNATRHELGHALGIWGHSPFESDVMYFSQVRTPPSISPRDINTLKKIYQQPTRLGWELMNEKWEPNQSR